MKWFLCCCSKKSEEEERLLDREMLREPYQEDIELGLVEPSSIQPIKSPQLGKKSDLFAEMRLHATTTNCSPSQPYLEDVSLEAADESIYLHRKNLNATNNLI